MHTHNSSNRTFMELKSVLMPLRGKMKGCSNRTFMELKFRLKRWVCASR